MEVYVQICLVAVERYEIEKMHQSTLSFNPWFQLSSLVQHSFERQLNLVRDLIRSAWINFITYGYFVAK